MRRLPESWPVGPIVGELRDQVRDFHQATTANQRAARGHRESAQGETEMRAKLDASAAGQRIAGLIQRVLDTTGGADAH